MSHPTGTRKDQKNTRINKPKADGYMCQRCLKTSPLKIKRVASFTFIECPHCLKKVKVSE